MAGRQNISLAELVRNRMSGELRLSDIRNRLGDHVADIVRSCSASVVNTFTGQTSAFIDENGSSPGSRRPPATSSKR